MLTATFLGHQSWAIADDETMMLVDPVVTRRYGNSEEIGFEVWPPREVDLDELPDCAAIVITNEHLDHFHLESLARLRHRVGTIVVPPLFPHVAEAAARRLGYQLHRASFGEGIAVGSLRLSYLEPDSAAVPVWEARCASPAISTADGSECVVIQSDTLLRADAEIVADIAIVTHNGQVRPDGWMGGLDNVIDDSAPRPLEIMRELAVTYLAPFRRVRHVTFSGGGYRHVPRRHAPFELSDFGTLADRLNTLSFGRRFHGLRPGETLSVDGTLGSVPWVRPADPLSGEDGVTRRAPGDVSITPIFDPAGADADSLQTVLDGLARLNRLIAATDFGQRLVDANSWLGADLSGDRRLVIHLRRAEGEDLACYYDINEARFLAPVPSASVPSLIATVPFGLTCWVRDLAKVFDGTIQIWELAATAALQWYPDEPRYSPLGFLFEALSEPVRPDLAQLTYENILRRCLEAAPSA